MSGLSLFARLLLRLANWIAGPERQEWVLAMASETDAAGRHGTRWAFGCLRAALRDRLTRDGRFYAALALMPAAAFVSLFLSMGIIMLLDRIGGVSTAIALPVMILTPLPFAALLGRMRPHYAPLVVGSLSFLAFEAGPMTVMAVMSGRMPTPWSPNLTVYNLPAWAGLTLAYAVWIVATALGGRTRRA